MRKNKEGKKLKYSEMYKQGWKKRGKDRNKKDAWREKEKLRKV